MQNFNPTQLRLDFDQNIGPTYNPEHGKPEYFNVITGLGGIGGKNIIGGDMLQSMFTKALPSDRIGATMEEIGYGRVY